MKLIGYFRSSAAFRVWIAPNLEGIVVQHESRHLRRGEQAATDHAALDPRSEEGAFARSRHWIETGLEAYEATICEDRRTGTFSHGDHPTMADLCLIQQVFNATRFKVDMNKYPTIQRIGEASMRLPAFDAAQPANQADAEP